MSGPDVTSFAEALLDEVEEERKQDEEKTRKLSNASSNRHNLKSRDGERRSNDYRGRPQDSGRDRPYRRYERSSERRERNSYKDDLMGDRSDWKNTLKRRNLPRSPSPEVRRYRRRSDEESRYRRGGRARGRSRSPDGDRYYRPSGGRNANGHDADRRREREPHQEFDRRKRGPRRPSNTEKPPVKTPEPEPTEDERDKRTVFVQQLAARLRSKELIEFFERAGPVKDAQIVKDRVSGRSKGVGYVEFKAEESVQKAIDLTGQKLLNIPIIAQLTEAEKNRQARRSSGANGNTNSIPPHRLYVGNIHFSVTEEDISSLFEPYGELEFAQLQKDDQGRSRGYGFVQFVNPENHLECLQEMNGFVVAGRPMRVGLGNDRFAAGSAQTLLQKFGTPDTGDAPTGSQFSGAGGRGYAAGGSNNFDSKSGAPDGKGTGGSALDDNDVNYKNFSRTSLMQKLAREEDNFETEAQAKDRAVEEKIRAAQQKNAQTLKASRCLLLQNMFDPEKETEPKWAKEMEEEIREECDGKYGKVVHIHLDPSTKGDVYIAFKDVKSGDNALKGLNGRLFAGLMINAQPLVEAVYKIQFPRAAL